MWTNPNKMASNCLLNCAIGVQEFLKSPEKEPLEVRLEKDETKKNDSRKDGEELQRQI